MLLLRKYRILNLTNIIRIGNLHSNILVVLIIIILIIQPSLYNRSIFRQISELDFQVYRYRAYGREFMKSCRTSPDVYIQLALQYAYYKYVGQFFLKSSKIDLFFDVQGSITVYPWL